MTDEHDRSDILYLALTRPALLWNVPVEAVGINAVGSFMAGIILQSPTTIWRNPLIFWLAAFPIHFILQRIASYDYHMFRTFRLWAMTTGTGRIVLDSAPQMRPASGKDMAGI